MPKTAGVFDEIERFYADAKAVKAQLPVDADWLVEELRFAGAALKVSTSCRAPIHGDGNVSNI